MEFPEDLKYTKEHEWVRFDTTSGTAVMGITEFAQQELGDIVFVELPNAGKSVAQNDSVCVVESTKAASDVYAPVGGVVAEVNESLSDAPEAINAAPYEAGWLVKLEQVSESDLDSLMDATAYRQLVGD